MITYKRLLWTSVLILVAGIVMLCYKIPTLEFFVSLLGWLLLIAGVLNAAMQFVYSRRQSTPGTLLGVFTAIAAIALGLWMVLFPTEFATIMIYILGALMILAGSLSIYTLAVGFKPVKFPRWFYIIPSLVTLCGLVVCLLSPATTQRGIVVITAIVMILYAIGGIIQAASLLSLRNTPSTPSTPTLPQE